MTDYRRHRKALSAMTPAERFWFKVQKSDRCWLWMGFRDQRGYGKLTWNSKSHRASRAAWELNSGPVPVGILVCHHCDNPPCVRPDHLFLGTPADNMHDAQRKGRMRMGRKARRTGRPRGQRGEGQWAAKLTAASVKEIRDTYARGGWSMSELAVEYGVNISNVCRLIQRKLWRDVA